jgi:RimJ/RimL family protein N-acetyltransferase
MRLQCDECVIRSWRPDDAAALRLHADDRLVWVNLRDSFPHPYTDRDAREWVRLAAGQSPETHFALTNDDAVVGGIGIRIGDDVFRRSAEIGYWLGSPYWGRGIATAAVRALTAWAFEEHDLVRLWASVFAWNPASARVLEKAGYACEGRLRQSVIKDGLLTDQLLYARVRD